MAKLGRKRTAIPEHTTATVYSMRNMRVDLLDRAKLLALKQRVSVEHIMNEAIARGLSMLEGDPTSRTTLQAITNMTYRIERYVTALKLLVDEAAPVNKRP